MSKDSVGTSKDEHNITLTDNSDKAELINKHFGSVCTVDGKLPNVDGGAIDSATYNTNAVQKAIKKFKSNIASGRDDLPPIMFKYLSSCFAEQLSLVVFFRFLKFQCIFCSFLQITFYIEPSKY